MPSIPDAACALTPMGLVELWTACGPWIRSTFQGLTMLQRLCVSYIEIPKGSGKLRGIQAVLARSSMDAAPLYMW